MREIIAKVLIDEVEYRAVETVEEKRPLEAVSPPPSPEPKITSVTPKLAAAEEAPERVNEILDLEPRTDSPPEAETEAAPAPETPLAAANGVPGEPEAERELEELIHPGSGAEEPQTPRTPAEMILFSFPERFRADKAGDYQGIFHFKLTGNEGGDYTVTLGSGRCSVKPGLTGKATCVLESSAKTYLDMETGKTNPQIAFMMGKVKISNVPEMMQFLKFFRKLPDT